MLWLDGVLTPVLSGGFSTGITICVRLVTACTSIS